MYTLERLGFTWGLPSWNRTTAVAMVVIQAFTLTLLMEPVMRPVLAVALVGWLAPQMRLLLPIPTSIGFALLLVGGVVLHQVREEEFIAMGFIGSKVAFEVSCCCLACQLFLLFVKKYADRLPVWYLALSGTSMVFAGDIRVTYENSAIMLWVIMLYLLCWAGFAISYRSTVPAMSRSLWQRRIVILCVLVGAVSGGRFLAITYHKYANRLEFWVTEYLYQGRIGHPGNGFSGKGGLDDIVEMKGKDSENREALRIQASFYPDYLRGCVFTEFSRHSWQPSIPGTVLSALPEHAPLRATHPHESVFLLSETWPAAPASMIVWPVDSGTSAHFFLPLGTAVLACDGTSIKRDKADVIERDSKASLDSYLALIDAPPKILPDEVDPIFLRLPDRLSPEVTQVAHEIFRGQKTTQDKIRAVETYFHNNFSYSRRLKIPRGTDRLAYFLTHRPGAHCEYFATATALLLRVAQVPSRYVTGYVVSGQNPLDGTYFALRRDAHAWVEAYDNEQHRWVIVESTPAGGIPARNQLNSFESARSASWGLFLRISELLQSGVIANLVGQYGVIVLMLMPIPLLVFFAVQIYLKKHVFRWTREVKYRPEFAPLARERISLDRFLSRRGMQRPADESLLQFADRIQAARQLTTADLLAEWYRTYVKLRFQDRPFDSEAVAHIRERRRELVRTTKVNFQ